MFIRPLIDYGDISYDKALNTFFDEKQESVKYTGKSSNTEKKCWCKKIFWALESGYK